MLLLEPWEIESIRLKNRVVMPPMCMYSAGQDGRATDFHYQHYVSRAVGGIGLIIIEATAVSPEGRISDHDLGLWSDSQIEPLQKIVAACHAYGAKVALQLAHAGRKSTCAELPKYAPSAIDFNPAEYACPSAMTVAEIQEAVRAFGQAAARAARAGFDAVEIHAAHGYLIHEFLSPLSNTRSDAYGGSPEKRSRFLQEVVREVRRNWPTDRALWARFSATDWLEGGLTTADTAEIINQLQQDPASRLDLAHVSSGGLLIAPIKAFPGYQVGFAEAIRQRCGIPVIAVGLISDSGMAEEIVQHGRADLVALGRELLRNPYWVLQTAHQRGQNELIPEAYRRGF